MPVYKGTLLFEFLKSPACGFSESIEFFEVDDDAARLNIATWPTHRRKWLSKDWKITGFRLSSVTIVSGDPVSPNPLFRCVKRYTPVNITACVTTPIGLLGDADSPYTAVYFRINMAHPTAKPRAYLARGIPDTWWAGGGLSTPGVNSTTFTTWFNTMVTLGAGKFFGTRTSSACVNPNFVNWFSACQQRIASRRIGRPFGGLRGARRRAAAT